LELDKQLKEEDIVSDKFKGSRVLNKYMLFCNGELKVVKANAIAVLMVRRTTEAEELLICMKE
jgi:hypothetical protein